MLATLLRPFGAVLVLLCAVRVAIPLAALAASGSDLPGLPRYEYEPTPGDGSAYYAAAREFLASWGRLGRVSLALIALGFLAGAFLLLRAWTRRPRLRPVCLAAAALLVAVVLAAPITQMLQTGAGAVGWPLLWALPMLPYRALGLTLDPGIAFGFGVAVSLLANVVSVVAIAYAGRQATRRPAVGLLAAAVFAFWPLLTGIAGGSRAWENGTWHVDAGLHMYTEPVSTALVAVALAILVSSSAGSTGLVAAGIAAGLAVTVRPTNGIFALAAFLLVSGRNRLYYLAGALAVAPIPVAFWPRRYGYQLTGSPQPGGLGPEAQFSPDYFVSSWSDSLLFTPRVLAILVPLALVGAFLVRSRRVALLLGASALANPILYSFFWATEQHPRYLYASLPATLVLWAAGVVGLTLGLRKGLEARTKGRRDPNMISA